MRRVLIGLVIAWALAGLVPGTAGAAGVPYLGLSAMGMPASPQPWMPSDFAVSKHFRQSSGTVGGGYGPPADSGNEAMQADHGADCSAPPATHVQGTDYASLVFVCHDHLMTAINSGAYGEVLFQPAQLVDWSSGPVTVSISVSTKRYSARDWIDWQFVPFAEQLAVNTDNNVPESIKLPVDAVRLGQTPGGCFCLPLADEIAGGVEHNLGADWWTDVNSLTPASAVVRTPVTITISRTHVREVMAGHTFLDTDFPVPLSYTRAVFQVMHHSYNPTKDGAGSPATWHWSDLSISQAVPYSLSMAMPDAVGDYSWLGQRVTFPAAPTGAFLRSQYFDNGGSASARQVSYDNGATWQTLQVQRLGPLTGLVTSAVMVNVWSPVPAGATSALLRGAAGWYARDLYVLAAGTPAAGTPTPTALPVTTPTVHPTPAPTILVTPVPTATATVPPMPTTTPQPSPTPSPSPIPIQNVPCTVTLNGITQTGRCSGTFTPGG